MTLETAKKLAQECANKTGTSTLVYQDVHKNDDILRYDYGFTLPTFGIRIGERFYPEDKSTKEDFEEANRQSVLNAGLRWPDGLQNY